MALIDVKIEPRDEPLPEAAAALIADARDRIDRFIDDRRDDPIAAFVPCDFVRVWGVLAAIREAGLAPGDLLCEWGSGFGVVACLADQLGYDAAGIEIEGDLVDEAEQLAADHGAEVQFAVGSFIPHGCDALTDFEENTWLDMGGHDGYEELGIDADDFDLVFAYPWPGEERTVERLFDRLAAPDALLVIYRDIEGIQVMRKR